MKILITYITFGLSCLLLSNCSNTPEKITNPSDYANYVFNPNTNNMKLAMDDQHFWTQKLEQSPNQFPYLAKIANAETQLFKTSGAIEHLIKAEDYLLQLNDRTDFGNAAYLRSLARNYISQHKFKDALELLLKAEANGKNLRATQCMLFDVHLELGNVIIAEQYLRNIKNFNDFDYLIRLSKYNDHMGNLDDAIRFLEKAKAIAENSNLKSTMQWTYTNLADYYGHAGRIRDSYEHYLKALQLDAEDAYAKKGIAWIVYSYERNPEEALRILESISETHSSPDYTLLKAELMAFMGRDEEASRYENTFGEAVDNELYGAMYNAYKIELWSEDPIKQQAALDLAELEVQLRPTAQAYDLLAWSYFKSGALEKAYEIIKNHVIGKTFEPMAQYHMAQILKASGKTSEVAQLKEELLTSIYELGPELEQKINNI